MPDLSPPAETLVLCQNPLQEMFPLTHLIMTGKKNLTPAVSNTKKIPKACESSD